LTDAYYELIDPNDPLGERFGASDHVISTWSPTMQNAAPVSALLVGALERCARRDDTRLSRAVVDLLGPVPVDGPLWVRAHVERPGTKIELLNAQMLAPGPDAQPRRVANAIAWRFSSATRRSCSSRLLHRCDRSARGAPAAPTATRARHTSRAWIGGG
jgi:hypothetical protein